MNFVWIIAIRYIDPAIASEFRPAYIFLSELTAKDALKQMLIKYERDRGYLISERKELVDFTIWGNGYIIAAYDADRLDRRAKTVDMQFIIAKMRIEDDPLVALASCAE